MELLNKLDACQEAKLWAAGKTLSQAWQECQRADWMLWLLGRSPINKKIIATIAVEIAETCVHNAKDYPAVAQCIAVVKRFLAGQATQEELSEAMSAAWLATWSATRLAAESAAEAAAWSAAWAAESAAESAALAATLAAKWSAEAAAWSAAEAARSAALAAMSAANCDIIRKHVSADEICRLFGEVHAKT